MLLVFQRKNHGRRAQGAFTLVELLVVVAVTVVLASLLLPALSGAREKSARAVCKSNMRQLLLGISLYADNNSDNLPSSSDNEGFYHSVRLSDKVFTNFVSDYLYNATLFYCPNVDFDGFTNHDQYGYIIGYSYLSTAMVTTGKGPDYWEGITKLNGRGTNELFADANYWSSQAIGNTGVSLQLAPHTPTGAGGTPYLNASQIVPTSTRTTTAPLTSAALGAQGGNIGRADMSVTWKQIFKMGQYPASDLDDATGNW